MSDEALQLYRNLIAAADKMLRNQIYIGDADLDQMLTRALALQQPGQSLIYAEEALLAQALLQLASARLDRNQRGAAFWQRIVCETLPEVREHFAAALETLRRPPSTTDQDYARRR